jgi:tetratricopeptide (TPR) repeat protein
MRHFRIFVSLPGEKLFEQMYSEAIKPANGGSLETVCFYDLPPVSPFHDSISSEIAYANIFVCILSGSNPNVLYEVGLAVGYGKPIIAISDSVKKLPAMLSARPVIIYSARKPNWQRISAELRRCYEKILHGEYTPLRTRTHTELLINNPQTLTPRISPAQGLQEDLLERAIKSYHAKDYGDVIRTLGSTPLGSLQGAEHAFFYLSDSHFLHAEGLPEGGMKQGHYEKMLEVADEGHRVFPSNRDLFKNVGLAHLKLRHLDFAITVFDRLLAEHPSYDVARYNLACVYAQRGELFNCIRELSAVIEREEAWRFLARVDPDFDPLWYKDLFQRLVFPLTRQRAGA